jgi:hypothetical protein
VFRILQTQTVAIVTTGALALLFCARAWSEPYLAVREGLKCSSCHVNPTGGGMRTAFGDVFDQTQLAAQTVRSPWGLWTGDITKVLRVGGDLYYDATVTQTPDTKTTDQFQIQRGDVYLEADVIPNRLELYADEMVAPGRAQNEEAYALLWSANHEWYIKAGQMYLPFAFRLQDQTSFVYDVSSITMYSPDDGVELGWEGGHWDAQLDVSDGTFATSGSGTGKEYGLQLQYVEPYWRFGLVANDDDATQYRRRMAGVFAGLSTGPVVWLGETDLVRNGVGTLSGVTQAAYLLEGDWLLARGNNLKVKFEHYDANRSLPDSGENRWSAEYEYFPVQFLALNAGVRYYTGAPVVSADHTKLYFVELHGFF